MPRLSAFPQPCCLERSPSPTAPPPPAFHLLSLRLTVPEGRGHLRTKWRISRQLCAHTLQWPSIIHPPQQPNTFSISSLASSSVPTVAHRYLPVALFTWRQPSPLFPHLSPSSPRFQCTPHPLNLAESSATPPSSGATIHCATPTSSNIVYLAIFRSNNPRPD